MKFFALDIGDVWTGTAISDTLRMFARPYQTVETKDLLPFLHELLKKEMIAKVVVGYPRTMRGTASEQTKKVEEVKATLEKEFPHAIFVFWDERLSSKRADALKKAKTKDDKIKSHSVAAAFILESFLQFVSLTPEE
jgi:putative Holliday junction resolvase